VLFEQRVGGEIRGITSRCKDDRTVLGVLLAVLFVLYTNDLVAVLEDLADLGLLEDFDSVRRVLREVFKLIISLALALTLAV